MQRMVEKSLQQQTKRPSLRKMESIVSNESKDTDDFTKCTGYGYELGWANSRTFIKQLAKDNIDPSLLNDELQRHAEGRRHRSWRARCLGRFRSNIAQILLCILVLIDSGIVIAEIILEIRSIQNYKELFDIKAQRLNYLMAIHDGRWTGEWCSGKVPTPDAFNDHPHPEEHQAILPLGQTASMDEHRLKVLRDFIQCWQTFVQHASVAKEDGCNPLLQRRCLDLNATEIRLPDTSSTRMLNPAMLHHASEVMHFVSIGVTGLFICTMVLKIVCLGRKFFSNVYEVADALVILISFISDISYIKLDSQEISAMVILLLWRIARLINAMLMYERQRCEFRVALQKRARRLQQRKVDSLQRCKELFQKHITNLEELARNVGCTDESIRDCKPRQVYHSKEQTQNALKSIAALTTGFMGGLVGAPVANKESIARFTSNIPPPHPANQVSQSSLLAGDTCSSGAYDSLTSCKEILASLIHEDGTSSAGSQHSLSNAARKELLVRNQAESLVRNVLLHQLSNALEESEAAALSQRHYISPRRRVYDHETGDKSLLRGLLGGAYRKQVSFEGRRERGRSLDYGVLPLNSYRRQTFSPLNKLNILFSRRCSAGQVQSNLAVGQYQHHHHHHQVTNDAFDTDETDSTSTNFAFLQPSPILLEEGPSNPDEDVHTTLIATPPRLQINEVETQDEEGEGEEVKKAVNEGGEIDEGRTQRITASTNNSSRSSEGLQTLMVNGKVPNLARRNSYCPVRLMPPDKQQLLLPERKTRSENGSQPAIIRNSSERRFYITPVPSPNSPEVIHTNKSLSNSVAVL